MEELTHKEALQRVKDVELELRTFCESSRELEEELELQLEDVLKERDSLLVELRENTSLVAVLEDEKAHLQRELGESIEQSRKQNELTEKEINSLKQRVVDTEVINDSLEQSQRALESRVQVLEEECGVAIEKSALLENDLFVQGNEILTQRLTISNQESTICELREKLDRFTHGIAKYSTPPLGEKELQKLQNVT